MTTCIIALFILVITALIIGVWVSVDFNMFHKTYEASLKNQRRINDCYSEKIDRIEGKVNTIFDQLPPKEISIDDAEELLRYNVFESQQSIKIIDTKEPADED